MIICKCEKEFDTKQKFFLHRGKCLKYQSYICSVLTKEFFEQYKHMPLFTITRDILKSEFQYATVVKCAALFGLFPSSPESKKYCKEVRTKTLLEKYATETQLQKEERRKKRSYSHIKNQDSVNEIDTVLTKEFFDNYKDIPLHIISTDILKNQFSYFIVVKKAKEFGISPMNHSDSMKNKYTQEKMTKTIVEKYGVENISQREEIKKQKAESQIKNHGSSYTFCSEKLLQQCKDTMIEKYGTDNSSKIEEFKEKKKETFLKHYGVENIFCNHDYIKTFYIKYWDKENPSQVEEFKKKKKDTILKKYGLGYHKFTTKNLFSSMSKELFDSVYNELNCELKNYVSYAPLTYETLITNNEDNYFLDFTIIYNDKKLCIEFDGDFWHMNPSIYKEIDVHPILKLEAKKIWDRDLIKHTIIRSNNFELMTIWESDYLKDKKIQKNLCLTAIQNMFGDFKSNEII